MQSAKREIENDAGLMHLNRADWSATSDYGIGEEGERGSHRN